MPWLRGSDTLANYPIVLAPLEDERCDDRLVNEALGFVVRCAAQSAAHLQDYLVSRGTAVQMAGPSRVDILLDVAIRAGYLTVVEAEGRTAYKIIDDPEFLHLRLRDEVEWERQRKRDNRNPAVLVPVRYRDGDGCRYCGRIVNWSDRKGTFGGTYDHRVPKEAATPDTSVVCCRGCNSRRKDNPGALELLPEPTEPYYGSDTIKWFAANQWAARNGYALPARSKKVMKPGDLAPGLPKNDATAATRPSTQPGTRPRPEHHSGNADAPDASAATPGVPQQSAELPPKLLQRKPDPTSTDAESADPADREGTGTGVTGRVGSGRDGSGQVGSGSQPDPDRSSNRQRRSRRRRSRRTA